MTMMRLSRSTPLSWTMAVSLLALLGLLAGLQYRWLGQVSRAEHQRMQSSLRSAVRRFAEDFDREVARAFLYFHLDPRESGTGRKEHLVERYQLWQEEAPYPGLVRDLFLLNRGDAGSFQVLRLLPESGRFEPIPWPDALLPLRARLEQSIWSGPPDVSRLPTDAAPVHVVAEIPALIIPGAPFSRSRSRSWRGRQASPSAPALMVVQLDLPFIREELFPELAERYFKGGEELDYELAIFNRMDFPSEIIYRSDPLLSEDYFRSSDASAGLFGFIPLQELRRLWLETGLTIRGERRPGISRMTPSSRSRAQDFRPPPTRRVGRGQWRLMVRHRAGSLEAAVSHARNRNLAISLGILALLAASLAMIVLSTQRAQRLAKQQIEFVAGVTHELRTPLAVIRSAGQNLADGVIDGKAQVKEYGALIEKEGTRLSGMVDQVLEFAGMQSQSKGYTLRRVRVGGIIETAVEDCRTAMEEKGLRLDIDVPDDLPPVKADPSALRRAIRNLLDNAIKYDDRGQSIGVRASTTPTTGTTEVAISVEDEGPGIPAADLEHVFEPFYRGRGAKTGQMRGSGLGLSLVQQIVEAHGGRVGVKSTLGQGSSFTIYLPAAPPHSSMS